MKVEGEFVIKCLHSLLENVLLIGPGPTPNSLSAITKLEFEILINKNDFIVPMDN